MLRPLVPPTELIRGDRCRGYTRPDLATGAESAGEPRSNLTEDSNLTTGQPLASDGGSRAPAAAVDRLLDNIGDGLHSRLGIVALAAALVAGGFVAAGGAPASQLGPGLSRIIPIVDAVLAGGIAAVLVLSPWEGLLAWIVATPVLNMAEAQATFGAFQLILPTIMVPILVLGWRLDVNRRPDGAGAFVGAAPQVTGLRDASRLAWIAAALISLLAVAAAMVRGDVAGLTISLHGFVEPAVLAAAVVGMRPSRRQLLSLLLAIGFSVAGASLYSIMRIGKLASTLAEAEALRVGLARFTYFNVGIFGDMLAMSIPALTGVLLMRGTRVPRAFLALSLAALAISLFALYLTYSKSAWLGTGVGISIVVLLAMRKAWQRAVVIAALAIAAAFVVPYPQYALNAVGLDASWYTRIVSSFQGSRWATWNPDTSAGEVSITERYRATGAALRMALDHPVLGVGPGQFAAEYAGPYHVAGATRNLGHAHDMIPNIAAEYGLPMALLITLILVIALVVAFRAHRRDGPLGKAVAAITLASLVGFIVVATTFGLDFYRPYRFMNSDVLVAGLLVAIATALGARVQSGDVESAEGIESTRTAPST